MREQQLLTTSDVSINTVAIEVKVMKIGNKQVTLAVFRQLPDEQIIDFPTGKLRGQPWGRVNYHPDCDKEMPSHFHVVWQKEGILYRAAVEKRWQYPRLPDDLSYDGPNPVCTMDYKAENYLLTRILEGWLPDQSKKRIDFQIEGERFPFSLEDNSTLLDRAQKSLANYKYTQSELEKWERIAKEERIKQGPKYPSSYYDGVRENAQKSLQTCEHSFVDMQQQITNHLKEETLPLSSAAFWRTHLVPAFLELRQFKQTWRQSYAQLEQLDQLFIAV